MMATSMTYVSIGRGSLVAGLITLLASGCGRETPAESQSEDRYTPVAAMELTERDLSRKVMVSAPVQPRMHIRLASRSSGTRRGSSGAGHAF